VRTCVIFNPAARGDKARRFRERLESIAAQCVVQPTAAAGHARTLAAEAVEQGFDTVVAAGGDGTLNEVLNGLGDAQDGFARARLGVLPLGTVNVFARELRIPSASDAAWKVVCGGRERRIDLPLVEYASATGRARRYFVQLAGAGWDARAVERVSWSLKKKVGPLAYVASGLAALLEKQPKILVSADGVKDEGELVLVGNGRFYGGSFAVFPEADFEDGALEVRTFPTIGFLSILRITPSLLLRRKLSLRACGGLRASRLQLSSALPVALQVDGELIGHLPAEFSVRPLGLRVIVP
jgi:diacylglycerol kinase (ATP)